MMSGLWAGRWVVALEVQARKDEDGWLLERWMSR